MTNQSTSAVIYTDGSCHTQLLVGAWVAIILIKEEKITLSGKEQNTTHNRMELTAVISAIEYIRNHNKLITHLTIYTDSQYVTSLQERKKRLMKLDFTNKKGTILPNADLVKKLLSIWELYTIESIKIKAHQKQDAVNAFNIEADMLSRKIVRKAVEENLI